MDEELNKVVDEGLKEMEEERKVQDEEDRARLSIKIASTLLEIMNDEPRGTYNNITPEEGSAMLESLEKRYPSLVVENDPGFLFWGNLFLLGYETFTVDFLDKIIKLEPTEVKLFFKGLYDIYVGSEITRAQEKYSIMYNVVNSYEDGKIEDIIKEFKENIKEEEDIIKKAKKKKKEEE